MAPLAPFVRSGQHSDGQDHDRIIHEEVLDSVVTEVVEITAWQKMLSATSGSLLTGLLGSSHNMRLEIWPTRANLLLSSDTSRRRPCAVAVSRCLAARPSRFSEARCDQPECLPAPESRCHSLLPGGLFYE